MNLVDRIAVGAATWVVTGTALAVPLAAAHLWRPAVALPVLAVALAVSVRAARLVPGAGGPGWAALLLVFVAVGSGVWAGATHAEHVVLRRDAGTYALYGQHLATAHGLPVDVDVPALGGASALGSAGRRVTVGSPGFYAQGSGASTRVVPQFLPATPVVLSLGWWAGGFTGLLLAPAVVLAFAVLAFGVLARRLVGPVWAVVATAALALSQPVLHAGRSTYSEPLALLVGCAGAAVLVAACEAECLPRGRSRSARLGLVAGLLVGSVALVRVDALRECALLLPVVALLAWRRSSVARPLLTGLAVGTAAAATAALLLSRPYLAAVAGSLLPLVAVTALLGGGSWLALRWARRGRRLPGRVAAASPGLLAALVLLGLAVLASRPLWQVVRQSATDPGARVVAALQLAQGLPVDGGRTYAESTLAWTAWWVGLPALVLAAAAAVWLAHRLAVVLRDDDLELPAWCGPALVGVGSSVLTLYRPGITPDHPWADRRLVPVVLPAVLLLATAAVRWSVLHLGRAGRAGRSGRAVVSLVGVTLLVVPALAATLPVAGQRTERGEVSAVRRACAAFGPGDTALLVDNRAANEWTQVLRGVCGVPSLVVRSQQGRPDAGTIRAVSAAVAAAGRRPVLVSAESPGPLTALGTVPRQVVGLATVEDQRLLTRRPGGSAALPVDLWVGPVSSTSP